jgi:hypothetical protein
VPVAIECEPGTRGPPVPDCPQHRPAAQLIEPIHGVHEEGATWVGGLRSAGLGEPGQWLRLTQPLNWVRSGWLERRMRFGRLGQDGGSFGGLPHGVDCALDPGGKAGTKIEIAGRVRGLMADDLEHALGHQAAVALADADWPHARTLVQDDQSAGYEHAICGPWQVAVPKPFG